MDITAHKEPARVLRNAVMGIDGIAQLEPGTRIIYHRGPVFSLSDNARQLGKTARDLMSLGRVWLYQKKLPIRYEPSKDDPEVMVKVEDYEWIAEVRG
jgi:hypothetical protein